jgi:hypothetical protein
VDFFEKLIAGNGNWISIVLAFAILPSFYLKFAFDMQKEYADLAKTIFSNTTLSLQDKQRLAVTSEEALQVFQLEGGLVWAIAILMLANFSAAFLVELSSFATDCGAAHSNIAKAAAVAASAAQPRIVCEKVKSLLSGYSLLAVLLMFFQIWWAKVAAIKRARQAYTELALLGRKEQRNRSISKPTPIHKVSLALPDIRRYKAKRD